ncbi:nitroreductase family protein [Kordiimonas aquimaris]|uniref:nitroreductase family protein n=1 Tax=Kordiimonas aquimaris TaxID=707591 RepID=UPI0021CF86BF|nr:nitroreductase [Kordiimonas aquimaris]
MALTKSDTSEPDFNTPNPATYDLLMTRRSVRTRDMASPGPDHNAIKKILAAGMRVPDHGKLAPWRFIVLTGPERAKLGKAIQDGMIAEFESSPKVAEKMSGYATQSPALIIAIYSPNDSRPIPEWEQQLSTGAACQNMIIAATALGYAAQWLTGWASYSKYVAKALQMKPKEKIAGFMFFGDHTENPKERPRPDPEDHTIWGWPADVAE